MNLVDIKKIVFDDIENVVGITKIVPIHKSKNNLNEEVFQIKFFKNDSSLVDLEIGIIVLSNINVKNVVEELHQILTYVLKKNNIFLHKLDIYIKGTE